MAGLKPTSAHSQVRPPGPLRLEIRRERDVYDVRFRVRDLAKASGFDVYDVTAIETAVSELATNILRHAGDGYISVTPRAGSAGVVAIEIVAGNAVLAGPPAPRPGPREGLGIGLGGVRRLMDEVRIDQAGGLLRVAAVKWLPAFRPPVRCEPIGIVEVGQGFRVEASSRPWRAGLSADGYVVKEHAGRLVAVMADVLGHGAEAADVARSLRRLILEGLALPPHALLDRLHTGLRGTRGACVTVTAVEPGGRDVRWAGVGNIRGRIWCAGERRSVHLQTQPGIAGYKVTRIEERSATVVPPACLALATDGVLEEALDREPQHAQSLVDAFRHGRDDATVVLVRW